MQSDKPEREKEVERMRFACFGRLSGRVACMWRKWHEVACGRNEDLGIPGIRMIKKFAEKVRKKCHIVILKDWVE